MGRFRQRELAAVEFFQRLADADAVHIAQLERARLQPAGVTLAAEVGAGEAHALLLGEAEHFDMKRQRDALTAQFRERHNRQQHA